MCIRDSYYPDTEITVDVPGGLYKPPPPGNLATVLEGEEEDTEP